MSIAELIQAPCSKCGQNSRHGVHSWCKACLSSAARSYFARLPAQVQRDRQRVKRAKAHMKNAGVTVEHVDTRLIYDRDGGLCQLCGLPVVRDSQEQSFDHRIPLSLGGSHTADNLQLAHRQCNTWKGQAVQAQYIPMFAAASLSTARHDAGLTIRQIADLMGVSTTAVQAWESGRSLPAPNKRPYLADVLGITRLALELALSNSKVIAQPVPERKRPP